MRAPDATRSANFAAGMGFALVTAVGWGLNWPVPKYLLTELPLLSTLKQGTIDAFALLKSQWSRASATSAMGQSATWLQLLCSSALGRTADISCELGRLCYL